MLIEKQTVVRDLEAKRKNLTLALDVINNAMKYIFFAEDRLKIEYDNSTYKLKSHGHNVLDVWCEEIEARAAVI